MIKKLTRHGRHTNLPLVGDTIVEICLSTRHAPAIVFHSEDEGESELRIEDCVVLRRGQNERVLVGSNPGADFNPQELSPLLELLGSQVREAVAEQEGKLRIKCSNELSLEIVPTGDGEAWRFQYPRPGRPIGGDVKLQVAVGGAPGRLI